MRGSFPFKWLFNDAASIRTIQDQPGRLLMFYFCMLWFKNCILWNVWNYSRFTCIIQLREGCWPLLYIAELIHTFLHKFYWWGVYPAEFCNHTLQPTCNNSNIKLYYNAIAFYSRMHSWRHFIIQDKFSHRNKHKLRGIFWIWDLHKCNNTVFNKTFFSVNFPHFTRTVINWA